MKAKKILFCEQNTDGTVGGSYYCLLEITTSLDRNKYEPIVIFYTDNFLIPRFRAAGIETTVLEKPSSINFSQMIGDANFISRFITKLLRPMQISLNIVRRLILPALKYARYLKHNNIDLVHLNNSILYNHDWMLAARLCGIQCITHERGINKNFPWMAKYFARRLDAVIAISQAVSNNMIKRGVPMDKVINIYDGIDPNRLVIDNSPDEIRANYHINPSSPLIGVVGNIKPWKGQETVVRAVANIIKKFPTLHCLIVGATSSSDKQYVDSLYKICEELELTEHIIFTGFQKNVADYMNAMDIVIHSSIEPEPFGIVLVEAMVLKKPLIATAIGAPLEIVIDGETGLLVPPKDPASLANAVIRILENPELAQEMGAKACDRVDKNFTLRKNLDQIEAIYEDLTN